MNNIEIVSPAAYQFYIFLEAVIIGFGLGFLLDFYRSLRNAIIFSYRITLLADLIFWITVTITSLIILLVVFRGEVHLYSYAGLAAGFLFYYYLLSRFITFFWNKVFAFFADCVKSALKLIRRIAAFPLFHKTAKK